MSRIARVAYDGAIHTITPENDQLRLSDGRVVGEDDVIWLPPVAKSNAIFALGLNYADHAAELSFKAPEEPLVFLKGPNTLLGHRAHTKRPRDVEFMHYECELVVVIGRHGKYIPRDQAMRYVGGYTVANDYAIRDYLENYYRPNLRVKNRDTGTPIGPWLASVDEVSDPSNLHLQTTVNGEVVQQGNTKDMVFDIPFLIEYLSNIMTLSPGDLILTGTPKGAVNVTPGDEVATEVEGIGRLVNWIVEDDYNG